MKSKNFEVNVHVTMYIEVEPWTNNCENKAYVLMDGFQNILHVVDEHEKTDFWLKQLFWIQEFFDP